MAFQALRGPLARFYKMPTFFQKWANLGLGLGLRFFENRKNKVNSFLSPQIGPTIYQNGISGLKRPVGAILPDAQLFFKNGTIQGQFFPKRRVIPAY